MTLWLLVALALPADAEPRRYLYIQPLGQELPDVDVALVKQALVGFYRLEVKLLPRQDLPARTFYKPRKRYRAEKLLTFIESRLPADGYRILGLTGVDISTTKGRHRDWGVLGLATIDGAACVISSHRCRVHSGPEREAGAPRSRAERSAQEVAVRRSKERIRLAKVAVHEIGHTLGLEHCPVRGCLMEDARGKVATCDREYDICPTCRARLRRAKRAIPDQPEIPWPRP